MAFQFASTNLVLELGILLAVLMGWQFTLAEFTGGPLMIVLMVLLVQGIPHSKDCGSGAATG